MKKRLNENYTIRPKAYKTLGLLYGIGILFFIIFIVLQFIQPVLPNNPFMIPLLFIFLLLDGIGFMNMVLWKVTVKDETILFRNMFGLTNKYTFKHITDVKYVSHSGSNALVINSGITKLFIINDTCINYDLFRKDLQYFGLFK